MFLIIGGLIALVWLWVLRHVVFNPYGHDGWWENAKKYAFLGTLATGFILVLGIAIKFAIIF